ncbi:hypothetical protein GGQ73_004407 [Rhizobium skierniewicense]|uniref:Antitoxin VbhA domain-containing protein n=1 Tax=Rhizobium skierniewicense TaxID=984260 RepID=A0A7W6CGT4_9HYPH|nr:hypothetical protein [Rhizobium skierniewicense]MBB3948420.1 hypothetical protein [Rhizobium skierniewicense]
MNIHQSVPDRSPEAIAQRRRAADQARAMIARQGYKHNQVWEDATEAYVNGDISDVEYRAKVIRSPKQA